MEKAYKQHKDNIFKFSLYLTGNRELSEDIVHETFLKFAEQKDKIKDIRSTKDWLFICARNLTYNHLKKKLPSNYNPLINYDSIKIEQKIFIRQVLGKLDVKERELILLREHQQYPIKEIAAMLELSEEAVRVRLFRIRKKMQSLAKE